MEDIRIWNMWDYYLSLEEDLSNTSQYIEPLGQESVYSFEFAKILMPTLTEKELAVYKRGRNAAPKCTPKNGSVADYHSATGLEALFGYLQINKEFDRINQLFEIIIHTRFGE